MRKDKCVRLICRWACQGWRLPHGTRTPPTIHSMVGPPRQQLPLLFPTPPDYSASSEPSPLIISRKTMNDARSPGSPPCNRENRRLLGATGVLTAGGADMSVPPSNIFPMFSLVSLQLYNKNMSLEKITTSVTINISRSRKTTYQDSLSLRIENVIQNTYFQFE